MYDGLPGWYDAWKTACCNQWPNCKNCPADTDPDPYEEYGSREKYLQCLADDYGVDIEVVESLADALGPNEDFDGLVNALEDM